MPNKIQKDTQSKMADISKWLQNINSRQINPSRHRTFEPDLSFLYVAVLF